MYLTQRHIVENELIAKVIAKIFASGRAPEIQALTSRHGQKIDYMIVATATALSMVSHADKQNVADPMTFFDIGKIDDYIAQVQKNSASTTYQMTPTLTTYPDQFKLRYPEQFTYKRKRYEKHPIEKKFEQHANIRSLTPDEHRDHILEKLSELNIRHDPAEITGAMSQGQWSYSLPVIIDETNSRHMLRYRTYSGELEVETYHKEIASMKAIPRLIRSLKQQVIDAIEQEVAHQADIEMNGQMMLNLNDFINSNGTGWKIGINVYLPIIMLNHHLRDENTEITACGEVTATQADVSNYEATGRCGAIENEIDKAISDIIKTVKGRGQVAKRRAKAQNALGDNALSIDRVAQQLIMLVANENPNHARDIINGTKKHYNFKRPQDFAYLGENRSHEGRVGFRFSDGKLTATFKMSENQNWLGNALMVPPIPVTIAEAIIGKPAQEIVDHPIAGLLGPVKNVSTRYGRSVISFKNIYDPINRETLLAQIPEQEK